jgi:putative glutamine amidotransferase
VPHHGCMSRPLIGITSEMAAAGWGDRVREAVLLPASYVRAVDRAGCVPVLLPYAPRHAAELTAGVDGIVFSDGADVDARRFGTEPQEQSGEPDLARDAGEFALMAAAIEAGLPVLAIGRGMQVLNAVRGGSVIERQRDAAADGTQGPGLANTPEVAQWGALDVRISPDSRLGRLLGASLTVPVARPREGQHRAVDRLGRGLSAVAWADDGTVEAVELTEHPFAIGVQWHPEQGEDLRIFEDLRTAASAEPATV